MLFGLLSPSSVVAVGVGSGSVLRGLAGEIGDEALRSREARGCGEEGEDIFFSVFGGRLLGLWWWFLASGGEGGLEGCAGWYWRVCWEEVWSV